MYCRPKTDPGVPNLPTLHLPGGAYNACCLHEGVVSEAWNSCKNGEGIETIKLCMTNLLIDQGDAAAIHCICPYIPTLC